jgi:iron complex outermembrane receptor protein
MYQQYKTQFRTVLALSTLPLSLLLGAPVAAQTTNSTQPDASNNGGLADIVVTADKRSAVSLQKVPITVQAISGEVLTAKGAKTFEDFAGSVPGLQFDDLGPGDKKYIIRGINSTGASTVGVYYDEAVITAANSNDGGGRNADIRLYDLERIEVLKGPQGTLYGASSMSGTIRFITAKPKMDVFEGNVTGDISDTQKGGANYNLHGTLNIPIVPDLLAIRATGWLDDQSGYIDAVRIPAGRVNGINNDNTKGGRVLARFTPAPNLNIVGSVTVQRTHSDGSSRYTPPGVQSFGNAAAGYPSVPGGDLTNTDLTLSPLTDQLHIDSLTADYKPSIGTFTATSNWYDRTYNFSFDSTPVLFSFGVNVPAITHEPQYRRVFSNELRYASNFSGPLNLVVGGFLQREKTDFTVNVVKSNAFGNLAGPFSGSNADDALSNPNGNTFFGRSDNQTIKQEALFGEITLKPIDGLTGVFGARYFHSTQFAAQQTLHPFGGFTAAPVGVLTNQSTNSKVTYKFNLSYQVAPRVLTYATAAQGFRVGGVNAANLPFASNIPRGYSPDSLWSYELGVKSELLDRHLRLNADVYQIDWSNIQVSTVDSTGAFPFITNAGKARVRGVEVELEATLLRGLEFDLGASYQNAILLENQPIIAGNPNHGLKGDTLPNVPKLQGNASLSYSFPLTERFEQTFRADVTYRDHTKTQFNNISPFLVPLHSYFLVNLRATAHSKLWSAGLYLNNVFDKRAQIDAISSSQDPLALLTVRPRTGGVTVTRNF